MDLGAFHRARASCFVCILGLSQSNLSCVHLGAFAEQANSNAFPLGVFLSCVHLGAFRGANNFKSRSSSRFLLCMHLRAFSIAFQRLSSSRFPILCASWGLSQTKQIQTSSLFGHFPSCVHLAACRRTSKFKRLSSSRLPMLHASCGLSQRNQVQTPFFACILGRFTEQANSDSRCLSSSRFPVLCAS